MTTRRDPPSPSRATLTRRQVLRAGWLGLGGLTLADLLRLRAAGQGGSSPEAAVIFISLGGGASHFETYDPKPEAPAEYRGALSAIRTAVPGVSFCELLPRQARLAGRLAVLRSVHHEQASHIALHIVETGYDLRSSANARKGEMPSVGSVVSRVRGGLPGGLPAFVSLPRPQAYTGPHWLGAEHDLFAINDDPNSPDFRVRSLALLPSLSVERLRDRQGLRTAFDGARRLAEGEGGDAGDRFVAQAFELITGERARHAFDIGREPDRVRDGYGRGSFGQRLLLARRLVEAGVPFVHVRTFDWDDHQKLVPQMKERCAWYDLGISALVEDLGQRGLTRDVLVVAMGEFGRTPRVNAQGGRDHWPQVMSVLLAGGRYQMGQVIGASDAHGARPVSAPYRPQNVLAMVYHHLGIDPATTFPDYAGRPRHLLEEQRLVSELL